jgi:hypothetical protein
MELVPVHAYVAAVRVLLRDRPAKLLRSPPSIYVATEDPKAIAAFRYAAPPQWAVYGDQTVDDLADLRPADGDESPAGHSFDEAAKSKGWAGTANLASLLIAMQAREFVLSTGSNWSRLMNELRKAVLDDRCDGCTRMIDLQPGEW